MVQLAEVLIEEPTPLNLSLAKRLYAKASRGALTEVEIRRIATGLGRAGDENEALKFLDAQMAREPGLLASSSVLRSRAAVLFNLGRLDDAEGDLRHAHSLSPDPSVLEAIESALARITLARQAASSSPSPS